MAKKPTPNYTGNAPGAINPGAQDYWKPLLDVTGITLNADAQTGVAYTTYQGQQVFVIPTKSTGFVSGERPYVTSNQIISMLMSKNAGSTKQLEKQLGLSQTGIPGNPALVQRYLDEARKASVNNVAIRNSMVAQGLKSSSQVPIDVISQTRMSILSGDVAGGGGGTRRSRSISITQFSEGDARGILEQFYADTVGRRPTDKEVKKFNSLINQQAKKQPSTSTTTYGADGTATTMSGGAGYSQADAQIAARKMAESDPEASAFLSSTRYLDAFMNTIGSQA